MVEDSGISASGDVLQCLLWKCSYSLKRERVCYAECSASEYSGGIIEVKLAADIELKLKCYF